METIIQNLRFHVENIPESADIPDSSEPTESDWSLKKEINKKTIKVEIDWIRNRTVRFDPKKKTWLYLCPFLETKNILDFPHNR